MNDHNIHILKAHDFQLGKIVILMIPGMVFLLVLLVYLSVSSYNHRLAASTLDLETSVMGVSHQNAK